MAWQYQPLLNQNLQILLTLGLGMAAAYFKLVSRQTSLPTLNAFVFNILLPASVLLGLGLMSDLRDGSTWRFIGAFIMMRAITMVVSILLVGMVWRKSLGFVAVHWLLFSWVSTVVLGVPLIGSLLGPQYASLGVVAGISSFIFQLPVMLFMFELHSTKTKLPSTNVPPHNRMETSTEGETSNPGVSKEESKTSVTRPASPTKLQLIKQIAQQLSKNLILWAILVGIILSVTTLGPKYLYPGVPPVHPNCSYAPGSGFIFLVLSALAGCTEPVALFTTGVFLSSKSPFAIGLLRSIAYMIAKCVLVPAVMVGCAKAVGLENAPARASVILASLPITGVAFTLADRYDVGQNETLSNILFGNLLVLPTTLSWVYFMDAVNLFETASYTASTSSTCS